MGEQGDKKLFLDSAFTEDKSDGFLIPNSEYRQLNTALKSTLFSRGTITESFFTEDSHLYITPREAAEIARGIKYSPRENKFDGVSARIVTEYRRYRPSQSDFLYRKLVSRYKKTRENLEQLPTVLTDRMSLAKLWNFSVVGAVIVGMVSMTFIYRYLGMGAGAAEHGQKVVTNTATEQILGAETVKNDEETAKYIEEVIKDLEDAKKEEFEHEVEKMVQGYPIEKMLPYIFKQDKTVIAFLIGIAKKESAWGRRVPVYQGNDCFNYWGYRGPNPVGSGGHSCFATREEAVKVVAKRIEFLVEEKKLDTPAKMSIWKCGSACASDGEVHKWISDVSMYFEKLN